MLAIFAFALALLPALTFAQVYTVTVGTLVETFTLPPFGVVSPPPDTAVATATAAVTATPAVTATSAANVASNQPGFSTITVSMPADTAAATFVLPPFVNATGTLAPFTGTASNLKNNGLAIAFVGLAVFGLIYG
ncbi:hypothetical protein FGG08_001034 [Glutinoglossum americanum]|uniref:Uncharacterized protein n=1 Tax=Glutinoglossum americanum TaxID=1670608 RepID=A0A9P8IBZ4_9PEZI|nr:hypothetical protein FGG08_001034 [Glutinoglossum americanum]